MKQRAPKDGDRLKQLGQGLKSLREQAELTQVQLASIAGMPLRTLVNYEQGHREPGSLALLDILRALQADPGGWSDGIAVKAPQVAPGRGKAGRPKKSST